MTERLAARLGVRTEKTTVPIEMVGTDRRTIPTAMASELEVSGLDDDSFYPLHALFTIRSLFYFILFIYTYNDIHVYMAILVEVNMKNEITKTTMEGYG